MSTTCLHCGNPMKSHRSTKKYCSDNCKQLAFYRRSGLALVSDIEALPLNTIQDQEPALSDANVCLTSSFTNEFNEVRSVQSLNDNHADAANSSSLAKPSQDEETYKWVHSAIVENIAEYVNNNDGLLMFQHPAQYWAAYSLATVKWISLRLRCVAENIIKLSNFPTVHYAQIAALKEALSALISSNQFKNLPANYPFSLLIKEMEQKLSLIAKEHKPAESIRFRLSVNRKVELIAVRFVLADFVPLVKFSEVNFSE